MSRIDLNIVATGNFSQVETQLARLKAQAAALSGTVSSMSVFGPRATADMQSSIRLFEDSLRASGMFQTQMVNLRSETEKFGSSLQKGNIKLGDSFRIAAGHIRGQQTAISKLAREQVRLMNSTTVAMGDGRQMVITPRGIDEAINKQQILNQEYRIFRQVVANGSTQLINWGKNTQWAGRQLTVGLTVPLTIFGAAASKMFMDADKQLTRLAKVYGDASKGMVDPGELDKIREQTLGLAQEIASSMGVAVEQTIGIAADLAATGKEGNELLEATSEAIRLSVLGEVDRQEAMRATLSIQSVFNQDTKQLAETINFLNAVENQTSTSLDDLTEGIVKAGPVVAGLGGDVEDLALMMVAMREGGIPAAEAANAIKSSLASLINPTKQTRDLMNGFGIDLVQIVDKNAGNVTGTLVDLQGELAKLDELSRQRAIEQIFGKFQFSRINALMSNLGKAGSQTEEVLKISGMSVQQLAATAEKELSTLTESASMKFTRALEGLKASLIPIGQTFTEVGTLILNVANKILEIFNNLPDPVQNFIKGMMILVGLAGPLIMIAGVLGNFFGYLIKGVSTFMALKRAGRGVFEHFTPESIAARQASELVEQAVYDETKAIGILQAAIEKLSQSLDRMSGAAQVAGSSVRDMAQDTLAGAESAAMVSSGMPNIYREAGKTYTYSGGELSHLVPESKLKEIFDEKQLKYLMTPGTLLGSADIAEKEFQQSVGSAFASQGYYDPTTMGSRAEALYAMKPVAQSAELIKRMSEEGMARLYPTMEEHTAQIAKYQVSLEQLFDKDKETIARVSKDIETKISQGDMDGAARVLRESIDMSDEMLEQLIAERAQEYRSEFDRIYQEAIASGIDPAEARAIASQEMIVTATGRESETYSRASEAGKLSGAGFARAGGDPRRGSGMAIAALSGSLPMAEDLSVLSEQRIQSMRMVKDAERELAQTDKRLSAMSKKQLSAINKDINSKEVSYGLRLKTNRGEERFARIQGQWHQVTAKGIRVLELTNTKQKNLAAALDKKMIAERKLAVANARLERVKNQEAIASQKAAQANLREAEASLRAAQGDMLETGSSGAAAGKGLMGRMRGRMGGMGGMGALSALGMATMLIPTGEEDSGLSQTADVAGGIAMGAGTGAMIGSIFPGIGTAIGAGVGGIIGGIAPVMGILSSNAEKAAAELEGVRLATAAASGTLFDMEQDLLGIEIKTLDEIPLEVFGEKTEEAKSQLEMFTEALIAATEAEEDSLEKRRVDAIKGMTSADELISSSMFQRMIFEAVSGGASRESIELMLEGYLDVADKEYFADRVKEYLDSTLPDDASAAQVASDYINSLISANQAILAEASGGAARRGTALGRMIQETREFESMRAGRGVNFNGMENASLFDIISQLQQNPFIMGQIQSGELQNILQGYFSGRISEDQILTGPGGGAIGAMQAMGLEVGGEDADVATMMQILSALTDITALEPDVNNLAESMNLFEDNVQNSANSIVTLLANGDDLEEFDNRLSGINLDNLDPAAITEISSQLNNMGEQGPEVSNFFMDMINSGVGLETALKAVRLLLSGTITNIEELKALAQDEIKFNIRYEEEYTGAVGGIYRPSGISEIEMPGVSSLVSGARSSGSVDTSAIEEEFDKRIEQQDKIIEKIREEREERQKLLNLQEESLNFSIKEQGLKNQIARAKAEGNLAEAALLQSELDAERAQKARDEREKRIQEKEDRAIEEAEKAKKEIQEQKKQAVDAARGSGASGGGMSEDQMKRIEDRAKYLEGVLSQSIIDFGRRIERDVMIHGLGGFFDSEPVQKFRDEMIKLGVPIETVEEYLDQVFDSFIEKSGLVRTKEFKAVEEGLKDIGYQGEQLADVLPNAFAIIQDRDLTSTEKIDSLTDAFYNSGMEMDEARQKAKSFYDEVKKTGDLSGKIKEIADRYYGVADSARKAAFETSVLNIVTSNPSIDINTAVSLVKQDESMANRLLGRAMGGYISGPGGPTSDLIPAMLSNGEYVIRASSVDKYGIDFLEAINKGVLPSNAMGGMISRYPSAVRRMGGGGYIMNRYAMGGEVSSKMAEYNIQVNVAGTNASAEEIANTVMNTIKRKQSMVSRGARI